MSPTSYQTAPSRVCVSAFYRGTLRCQPEIWIKSFEVQSVSAFYRVFFTLEGRRGKAFSSIGGRLSIEKINSKDISYRLERTFIPLVLYTGVSEILPIRFATFPFLT
ncbi:hypothetical protein DMX02_19550 [Pseudomonas jessenii]|nr:hypothetical protein DMX02_19550 [Pseudomonas jessenii]